MESYDAGEHYVSAGHVFDGMAALAALTAVAGSLGLLQASFISPSATAVFAAVFVVSGRIMKYVGRAPLVAPIARDRSRGARASRRHRP